MHCGPRDRAKFKGLDGNGSVAGRPSRLAVVRRLPSIRGARKPGGDDHRLNPQRIKRATAGLAHCRPASRFVGSIPERVFLYV
ncbi:unnamed protein product, partial [Iphiclides podalirius]